MDQNHDGEPEPEPETGSEPPAAELARRPPARRADRGGGDRRAEAVVGAAHGSRPASARSRWPRSQPSAWCR